MTKLQTHDNLPVEALVGQIADEITKLLNRGEQPDIERYATRYPHIATLLREILPALNLIRHQQATAAGESTGRPASSPGRSQSLSDSGSLPGEVEERLDAVCDRFEAEWAAGRRPLIQDYCQDVAEAIHTALAQELILLDVHYRRRAGDDSRAADYAPHFRTVEPAWIEKVVTGPAGSPEPGIPLGDFRIVREIGRGGMGVVYEAQQLSLDRRVALKVLPFAAALDPKQLQRFKNEAQAAAHLHHQHIVPVYAVGCERGVHYYAMQYIDGHPLTAMIEELHQHQRNEGPGMRGEREAASGESENAATAEQVASHHSPPTTHHPPLTTTPPVAALSTERSTKSPAFFRAVAHLGEQAAEALEHAHQLGVVHRDIKPANLLVDVRGNLWITDFGLAHCQSQSGLTMTGDLVGTLRYMSPEQALGKRALVDHRTDIYSLGATLYELLTLAPALDGRDREELLRQIAFTEPVLPRRRNQGVPVELETIILKALAKSASERYATAQELADDLRRFLEDRPIHARRPTLVQRARKWARRHQAVVVTGIVTLLLASLVVAVVATVGYLRTEDALKREADQRQVALKNAAEAEVQRERAQTNLHQAEKRLAQIEKGNEIITSIFADLDIRAVKEGREPLEAVLAQRLTKAASELGGEAIGDPLVMAGLQERLGRSLLSLGHPQAAIPIFFEAVKTRRARQGPEERDTLTSANVLALAYLDAGKLTLALPLFEETLKLRSEKLGPNDPDTLASMLNLARGYQAVGKMDLALPLYEKTVQLVRTHLGPDDDQTLVSVASLAEGYKQTGKPDRALPLFEEVLNVHKAKHGTQHPRTLTTMHNLATCYSTAGKLHLALPLLEETVRLRKAKLGRDHPSTLASMNNLAGCYQDAGMLDLSLTLIEEVLQLTKARLGADHPGTLASMNNLASAYWRAKQFNKSIPLFEDTLQRVEVKFGRNHPSTLQTMKNLGVTYKDAGRLEEALPLLEEAYQAEQQSPRRRTVGIPLLDAYVKTGRAAQAAALVKDLLADARANLPTDSPQRAEQLARLGLAFLQASAFAEAETLLRESLAIREKKQADNWNIFFTQSMLGGALRGQKKYADAEPLLLKGYHGMKRHADRGEKPAGSPSTELLTEALKRLVQLYDDWGKKDKADEWRKELEVQRKEQKTAEKPK
jgi:serine/threonine protein kinase/Tfp pilus assembly protein PilF